MKVGDLVRFKMNHNRLFVIRAIATERMFGKETRVVFVGPDSWRRNSARQKMSLSSFLVDGIHGYQRYA
jgi:hypothetical protein